MEKLTQTIKYDEWRVDRKIKLPEYMEDLPKIIRDLVVALEKRDMAIANRINWLLSAKPPIEDHTADDTLTESESGSVHTNSGANGAITITLPSSASKGVHYWFSVQAAQELRIDPGTATIRDDCGQTADKYKTANAIGECIHLAANSSGDWVTISKYGTWTEEA